MPRKTSSSLRTMQLQPGKQLNGTPRLLQSWINHCRINQGQIRFGIEPLLHRYRVDGDHHFQRRRYVRVENMAGTSCSVWTPHHHVRMNYGLSLIESDIAAHRDHFVLTVDGNLLVHLALGIEPSQRRSIQRSDSGEMSARNVVFLRKLQQSGKGLVSLVEDDRILFRRFSLGK